ncbi:hypothetical protein EVAR_64525_1 [Eumeta japonica]|uniref:Uncharacterized protein n=1 Tax=Eumeta variegata TaxID=151549 RepID=A0A4C1ZG19_EUMVA|nr:hypothetical protein EVAR_64525_1 [Eumeta japonica]
MWDSSVIGRWLDASRGSFPVFGGKDAVRLPDAWKIPSAEYSVKEPGQRHHGSSRQLLYGWSWDSVGSQSLPLGQPEDRLGYLRRGHEIAVAPELTETFVCGAPLALDTLWLR